ncbi:MAG TPA: translation elongation factor 4 [Patescibacteria group bacterium]|nr:translation elongation factor 4 [Patescibacteria group bacterium]
MRNIRNFAIIAHVDHGKSTLADRFLELTGVVIQGKHNEQYLDRNPISRERGITIKLAPVRMEYKGYVLNLIDTPGHVDFSYEVERTLACVEGVILLVDVTQGIQAQTIAHARKAIELNLKIIPVINKIDVLGAHIEEIKKELAQFLEVETETIFETSAKTGHGVKKLLEAVIEKIPAPHGVKIQDQQKKTDPGLSIQALIFDSYFDSYQGVIAFVRIFGGEVTPGKRVKLYATNTDFEIKEVGIFTPDISRWEKLGQGEIGYIVTNLKDIHLVRVGDTITEYKNPSPPLSGYRKVKPMVYASIFPTDPNEYVRLKESMEKLVLSDASVDFEPIYSASLGSGLRAGFLGLLHADVVRERLEREFHVSLILTPPSVEYKENTEGANRGQHKSFAEPIVEVTIVTPQEFTGRVMRFCEESRGVFLTMDNKIHTYLVYQMPLAELITYFYDRLKTITSGYASIDWKFVEYRPVDADLLTILLNGDPVSEFSEFVVAERSFERAREFTQKLRDLIPRQQYEVKIQAQYKGKIIASERIAPFRKDVTGKLYGGDRTRKDKLLEKQKKGKKMLKNIGRVEIPKEVFFKLFKP